MSNEVNENVESEPRKRRTALSAPAKEIVRHITEGIRRSPASWSVDGLPYSDKYERLLDDKIPADGGYVRNEVAREAIAEIFRRRKSGRLKGRLREAQKAAKEEREAEKAKRRAAREAAAAKAEKAPKKAKKSK